MALWKPKTEVTYPIWIEDDDSVGSCEVYSKTTSSGTYEEEEDILLFVEQIHLFLSILDIHASIQTSKLVLSVVAEVVDDI